MNSNSSHMMIKTGHNGQLIESSTATTTSSGGVAILSADFDFLNECANTINLDKK